jgi:hypothetical protein
MIYLCPICGYGMQDAPRDYNICPCCGTEFGNDDAVATHAELRAAWLRDGLRWWSPTEARPEDWDPFMQVSNVLTTNPVLWEGTFNAELSKSDQGLATELLEMVSGEPGNSSGFAHGQQSASLGPRTPSLSELGRAGTTSRVLGNQQAWN